MTFLRNLGLSSSSSSGNESSTSKDSQDQDKKQNGRLRQDPSKSQARHPTTEFINGSLPTTDSENSNGTQTGQRQPRDATYRPPFFGPPNAYPGKEVSPGLSGLNDQSLACPRTNDAIAPMSVRTGSGNSLSVPPKIREPGRAAYPGLNRSSTKESSGPMSVRTDSNDALSIPRPDRTRSMQESRPPLPAPIRQSTNSTLGSQSSGGQDRDNRYLAEPSPPGGPQPNNSSVSTITRPSDGDRRTGDSMWGGSRWGRSRGFES